MAVIKLLNQKELKRYDTLFNVLAKYGFEDVLVNSGNKEVTPKSYLNDYPDTNAEKSFSFLKYEPTRMVLDELGPSYVILGQVFSNREDMLLS